jgi:hypothetical protein
MPLVKRRKVTELFTKDEVKRAMTLFLECKKTKESFNTRCTNEVVEPALSRVNAQPDCDYSPSSLVYRLEMHLKSMRGERFIIRH